MDISAIDWLRSGQPWGYAPQVVETHAALVFLVGDHAYKIKKAVNLGYLDFTTIDRRRTALERELVLNRRTAPELYLGLVPVVARAGAYALGGDGEIVEWLIEMRRFPDDALLAALADQGALTEAAVEKLAKHAARFHDRADPMPQYDWRSAVARIARENGDDLFSMAALLGREDVQDCVRSISAGVDRSGASLARASADVRHCHGDLHLANAFLDDGEPTLFDCIEFDDFYATIPPLYDIAFLIMDLNARGLRRFANRALNAWIIHRAPQWWRHTLEGLTLATLYVALRAEIRAKVEARRPGGEESARRYLALARAFSKEQRTPRLIAVGGLSGTGKSTLAKAIAWRFPGVGAVHLRSDEIRKRLAGVSLQENLPAESYTEAASGRVYDEMMALARVALEGGAPVVVDAVFARARVRQPVSDLAREMGVTLEGLWLEAPQHILESRVAARRCDASDADIAVLRHQVADDIGRIDWRRIDANVPSVEVEKCALSALQLD